MFRLDAETEQKLKTVKEALLTIALLVGALWTVYVYGATNSNHAKLNLERDIAKLKAVGVEISFDLKSSMTDGCNAYGSVNIKNMDSRTIYLFVGKSKPLTLARIMQKDEEDWIDRNAIRKFWLYSTDMKWRSVVAVVPGRQVSLPFAFHLGKPGLVEIAFLSQAAYDPQSFAFSGNNSWGSGQIYDACPHIGERRDIGLSTASK
jgi:hypothetical protein